MSTPEVAPIEQLPNEILAKIFETNRDMDAKLRSLPCLVAICGVSRRWRDLCLDTPLLWTNIRVPFHQIAHQDVVQWTSSWLKRCKSCLFDFTVDLVHSETLHDTKLLEVFQVLIPHVYHLRRLEVNGVYFDSPSQVLLPLREVKEAPALEELQFDFSGDDNHRVFMTVPLPFAFHSAPRLRRQILCGVNIQYPLTGLVALDIEGLTPNEISFRQMAEASPSLEELTLYRLYPMMSPSEPTCPKVEMPSLRKLTVSFAREPIELRCSVLSLISSPNLVHFTILGPINSNPLNTFPDPTKLLNLHTLHLDDIAFLHPVRGADAPPVDVSFFLALPAVKHLKLIRCTSPESLFPEQKVLNPKSISRSRSIDFRDSGDRLQYRWHRREVDHYIFKQTDESVPLPSSKHASARTIPDTWPQLSVVTLDSIRAADLVWLCELVALRPAMQTVYLSRASMRHLLSSLRMKRGPKSDVVSSWDVNLSTKGPGFMSSSRAQDEGDIQAEAWLKDRVDVHELSSTSDL